MQRKEMGFNANHFIGKVADFSKTFLQIMHEKYENVLKGVSDGDTEAHSQARKSFQRGISSVQARTATSKTTAELLTKHAKKIDSELIQDRSSSFFFGTIIVSCVCAGILIFLLYSRYKSATKSATRRPRAAVRESTFRSKRRLSCASRDRAPTISLPLACTVPATPLVTKVVNDEVKQTIYLNQNFKASESDIQKQIESVVCDIDFDVDSLDTSSFVICCHDTDDDENSLEGRLDLSLPDITGDGKPLDADSYLRQKYLKMGTSQETKANPIKKCAAMVDLHGGIEALLDENVNNVGNIESMKVDNDGQMDGDMLSDLCLESETTICKFTTNNDEKNDDPLTTTKETDVVKDSNDSDSNPEFIETPTQTDFSFLIVSKSQIPDSQPNADLGKSEISIKTFDLPMENQIAANKSFSRCNGPIKSQRLNYAMARRHSWTGFTPSVSPTQSKTSTTTNAGKSTEITKTKDEEDMHAIPSCTTTIITTTSDEHFISRDDVVVDGSQIDQSKDVGDITCEIIGDGPQIADTNVASKNSGDIDRSLSTKTLTESVAAEQCQEIEKSSISETGTMDVICTTIAERSQNAVVSSCSEITTSGTDMNGFSSDDHFNLIELKKELIAEAVELKKQALSVSTNLEVIQNNINKSLEKPKNTNQTQNFKSKIRKFQTKKQPSNVSAETKPLLVRQPSNLNKNKSIPSPRTPLKPPTPRNVLKKVENQIVKPSAVATVKESKALPILSTLPTPPTPSTPPTPLSPSIPTKSRIPIPTGRKYPSEMAVGDIETPPPSPASAQRRTMSVTPPKQRSQVGDQLRRPLMQRCSSSLNVLAAPPRRLKPISLRNRNSGSGSTSPRRVPAAPKTSACTS